MAEAVNLSRGKETLTVHQPTKAGLAALAKLGWQQPERDSKPPARKPATKK